MATGKSTTGTRHIKNNSTDTIMWQDNIERERLAAASWKTHWSWMADEMADLQAKLREVSKKSKFLSDVNHNVKPPDLRSIKPIPPNTNGDYGWLSTKKEFNLEVFGSDIFIPKPLPDEFVLNTGIF